MLFYVYGKDRPGPDLSCLTGRGALVLPGPVRGPARSARPYPSDDGTEHTGRVHVLDLADRASAERFAVEEPCRLAGLYQEVMIAAPVALLHRGPDEGPLTSGAPHALVTGSGPPEPRSGTGRPPLGVDPGSRVRFVAVLADDNQSATTGIVSIIRARPAEALRITQAFAGQLAGGPMALTAQRWRCGGRS